MLKAYAIGFFGAVLAIVLVAAIWLVARPSPEPGLVWGGTVYTSKEEFKGYLKSKGLSYKTWVARNPGAAPWEPDPKPTRAARPAPKEPEGESWSERLPLTTIGLMLAAGGAILLLVRAGPTAAAALAGQARRVRLPERARPPEPTRTPERVKAPERARLPEPRRPEATVLAQPTARALPPVVARAGPVIAMAEPLAAAPPPPRVDPTPVEPLAPLHRLDQQVEQVCEIRWWRGYVKGQFFVEADPPLDWPIESPVFRPRGREGPEQSDEALAAHEALVEELRSAGWEQNGRGSYWFSDRFLRRGRSDVMGPPGLEPPCK